MENEIKVNEFVRTKTGNITKVVAVKDTVVWTDDFLDGYCRYNEGIIDKTDIVKHSPNLIDLIQYGDYVNGEKVIDIAQGKIKAIYTQSQEQKLALIPIVKEQIESVVTKEQFESISYKVERKD